MSDFGFFIFLIVFVVMFEGEPDLHDALIHYFQTQAACVQG